MLPILVYFGFIGYVYFFPERVFYNPDNTKPNFTYAKSVIPTLHEVAYKTADGRDIYAWYATPINPQKAVIFFHGNSYNIYYHIPRVLPFLRAGYTVILPEYEGFGGIEGTPSQRNMEDNMRATIKFLNDKGVQNKDIVLYGHSLGTYMATYVAAKLAGNEKFDALILESPFTSLTDVADIASYGLFPVKVVVRDKYNSYDLIDKIGTRLMIAHGTEDPTVPYELGVKLFEKATGRKRFYGVKGANHRNLPENGFLDEALKWLGYPKPVQAQPFFAKSLTSQPDTMAAQTLAVPKKPTTLHRGSVSTHTAPQGQTPFVKQERMENPPTQKSLFVETSQASGLSNDQNQDESQPAQQNSSLNENESIGRGNMQGKTEVPEIRTPTNIMVDRNDSDFEELNPYDSIEKVQKNDDNLKVFEEEAERAEFGQNRPIKTKTTE